MRSSITFSRSSSLWKNIFSSQLLRCVLSTCAATIAQKFDGWLRADTTHGMEQLEYIRSCNVEWSVDPWDDQMSLWQARMKEAGYQYLFLMIVGTWRETTRGILSPSPKRCSFRDESLAIRYSFEGLKSEFITVRHQDGAGYPGGRDMTFQMPFSMHCGDRFFEVRLVFPWHCEFRGNI